MEKAQRTNPTKYSDPSYLILGEDQQGNVIFKKFGDLPHALIIGGTGSGKSKSYHGIIYGILSRNTPKDIQLILADPKTELHCYSDTGFMWHPMVRSPQELVIALERACSEGDSRMAKIIEANTSDITLYNNKMKST